MKSVVIAMGILASCFGCTEVKDGTITKCKHCDKEVMNTVQSRSVAPWHADRYKITYEMTYCAKCANEEITTQVHHVCLKCNNEYKTEKQISVRRDGRVDQTVRDEFCEKCGKEHIPSNTIVLCAGCGKGLESKGTMPRASLPDRKTFKGTVDFRDNCVTGRSSDGRVVITHRIDRMEISMKSDSYFCESCQKLAKRKNLEDRARKVGDAIGGVGGAVGKGILDGLRRNR